MKIQELIKTDIKICNLHADRLQKALDYLDKHLPFTFEKIDKFTVEELGILDMLTTRFANLQDTIGSKIFPQVLIVLEEDIKGKSFIDILNKLEKIELLPSAQYWRDMRVIRNNIIHEYPDNPELMSTNLNSAVDYIRELLKYWGTLNKKINGLLG